LGQVYACLSSSVQIGLFGAIGGLISELLAVFDPNLLAHSALITADVTAAFFFTAATWSFFSYSNP